MKINPKNAKTKTRKIDLSEIEEKLLLLSFNRQSELRKEAESLRLQAKTLDDEAAKEHQESISLVGRGMKLTPPMSANVKLIRSDEGAFITWEELEAPKPTRKRTRKKAQNQDDASKDEGGKKS